MIVKKSSSKNFPKIGNGFQKQGKKKKNQKEKKRKTKTLTSDSEEFGFPPKVFCLGDFLKRIEKKNILI